MFLYWFEQEGELDEVGWVGVWGRGDFTPGTKI